MSGSHDFDPTELTHTLSRGLPAPQQPAQLSDLHPWPSTRRAGKSPRTKGTGQPANLSPLSSAVALDLSIYCMPSDIHTLSLILTKPPGVGTVLLIYMGKGLETVISQALSASEFGFAGLLVLHVG